MPSAAPAPSANALCGKLNCYNCGVHLGTLLQLDGLLLDAHGRRLDQRAELRMAAAVLLPALIRAEAGALADAPRRAGPVV